VGAVYLIYLGIRTWRARSENGAWEDHGLTGSHGALFKSAYIVTALNPKSIAFFVAFLPQFVDARGAYFMQLLTLGATFLALALINAALYAIFAGALRDTLKRPGVRRWFNRCGGSALIGAGVLTATMQRTT
jgi:threonine/homoserine/homoserine lactone efflux protein